MLEKKISKKVAQNIFSDTLANSAVRNSKLGHYFDQFSTHGNIDLQIQNHIENLLKMSLGNPSSVHSEGRAARKVLRQARLQIAQAIGCESDEVIFTSGTTESLNLAAFGLLKNFNNSCVYTTSVEHKAISKISDALTQRGAHIRKIALNSHAQLDEHLFDLEIEKHPPDAILMQAVNQDLGVVLPIFEITKKVRHKKILFIIDAAQALWLLSDLWVDQAITAMAFSSHKIGGPSGVGALILRKDSQFCPLIKGGHQEFEKRAGTEAVILISAFAMALELALQNKQQKILKLKNLTEFLQDQLKLISGVVIHYEISANRYPGIISVAFIGVLRTQLIEKMSERQFFIASGSSCSSKDLNTHNSLLDLGISRERVDETIRISIDEQHETSDLTALVCALKTCVDEIRQGFT